MVLVDGGARGDGDEVVTPTAAKKGLLRKSGRVERLERSLLNRPITIDSHWAYR